MSSEFPSNHATEARDWKSVPQKELIDIVSIVSKEIYGAILNKTVLEDGIYSPANSNYFYFTAEDYFRSKTITSDMIDKLTHGGNLLSVGAGDGSLEMVLSEGFKIPKKNIVVSDHSISPELIQKGFRSYEFDMNKDWPDMSIKFDYILFPESLGVALMHIKGDPKSFRFEDILDMVTNKVLHGDLCPEDKDIFISVVETDVPVANAALNILKQAILRLKIGGEVRIRYGIKNNQQRVYIMLKLKEEYPNISFPEPNQGSNFTLKI